MKNFSFGIAWATPTKNRLLAGLGLGLLTLIVFNSLFFLARFPHGTVIRPWNFPLLTSLAFGLLGVVATAYFSRIPRQFLHVFFVVMVLSSGAYVLRFPILDEWLCLSATLGGFFMAATGKFKRTKPGGVSDLWPALFLLWIVHLAFMSLYGWVAFENPKALRFFAFYLTLFGFSLLNLFWELPRPTSGQLTKSLLWGSIAYHLLVIAHWKIAKSLGMQPHILEGIGFAGTAYLCLVGLVCVPLAVNEVVAKRKSDLKLVATISLVLAFAIALLSDSRAGFAPFLGAFLIASLRNPLRCLKVAAIGVLVSIGLSLFFYNHPHWLLDIIGSVTAGLNFERGSQTFEYYGRSVTAAKGDAGRIMYVLAALKALLANPHYLLTGSGNYSFFPVAGEHYNEIATAYGVNTSVINYGFALGGILEPPRPPALGAFALETGVIGTVLFAFCSLACIFKILVTKIPAQEGFRLKFNAENLMHVTPLLCVPLWMYFGEIQDVVFLYLLVAPGGILTLLAEPEPRLSK